MKAESKPMDYLKGVEKVEIPFFQRAYVWGEDNWNQLIEQWKYGKKVSHFLGSIIINNPYTSSDENFGNVEIIDGQQRLTTLTILYKVIFNIKMKNAKNDIEKGGYITQKNYILGEDNCKIIHSENDRPSYEYVMADNAKTDGIFLLSETVKANRGKKKKDRIVPSDNIRQCYKFFYEYFEKEENKDNVNKMWDDLNSSTKNIFVLIDINPEEDAQQIFDCTNSAGIRLSTSDLIKNALYKKVATFDCIDRNKLKKLFDETWKNEFEHEEKREFWDMVVSVGRIKKTNLEILLYCLSVIETWYNPEKNRIEDLYSIYKEHIDLIANYDETKVFISKIMNYAKKFRESLNNNFDGEGDLIDYNNKVQIADLVMKCSGTTTFYPYILKLVVDGDENKDKNIEKLIKLLLRALITNDDSTSKNYNKECYNLVTGAKNINVYYKERFDTNEISDENIQNELRNLEGRNSLANLLLFLLELKHRASDSAYDDNSKKLTFCYTLEHIMPQKFESKWTFQNVPFMYFDEKESKWINGDYLNEEEKLSYRKEAVYKIGNMILLSPGANSKNKNKLLGETSDKKAKIYNIKEYGSNLHYTTLFIDEYLKNMKWNEETIENRTKMIINLLLNEIL